MSCIKKYFVNKYAIKCGVLGRKRGRLVEMVIFRFFKVKNA